MVPLIEADQDKRRANLEQLLEKADRSSMSWDAEVRQPPDPSHCISHGCK
jgi:hypothetical protein